MTARLPAMEEPRWGGPLLPEAIALEDDELRKAVDTLLPGEDPEQGWTRYQRALALLALRRWLKHRKAAVVVGPEIRPEDPDRLLAIGGRATQLLCASSLAEEVLVPLRAWEQTATAPQLVLLAIVDEDNGVVEFPGVLEAAAIVAEIKEHLESTEESIELRTTLFQGGLERLLRWVTLLEPEALPRAGLSGMETAESGGCGVMEGLQQWLARVISSSALVPLPVLGTRGAASAEVRLITPEVTRTADDSSIAEALCSTPSIWADTPLAEILLEQDGETVWQQLATRQNPIEGPQPWPLKPLLPRQQLTIRLRPHGAAGGAYATLILIAPNATVMEKMEEAIQQRWQELLNTGASAIDESLQQDWAVVAEIRARQWLSSERGFSKRTG